MEFWRIALIFSIIAGFGIGSYFWSKLLDRLDDQEKDLRKEDKEDD